MGSDREEQAVSGTRDLTVMESGEVGALAEACWTLICAGFSGEEITAIRDAAEAELSERLRLYIAARRKTAGRNY
jgi:hypothetical protein